MWDQQSVKSNLDQRQRDLIRRVKRDRKETGKQNIWAWGRNWEISIDKTYELSKDQLKKKKKKEQKKYMKASELFQD